MSARLQKLRQYLRKTTSQSGLVVNMPVFPFYSDDERIAMMADKLREASLKTGLYIGDPETIAGQMLGEKYVS
jgi:hypothetical protein